MKDKEIKEQFIELRAKDLSHDKIAEKLYITKPTLLKWNKELHEEISKLENSEMKSVIEKVKISSKQILETFSKKLIQTYKAIENKDISEIKMNKLIELKEYLEKKIAK